MADPIDALEEALENTLRAINKRISEIIIKLETGKGGRLEKLDLKRLRATRRSVSNEFSKFNDIIDNVTTFSTIKPNIAKRIKGVKVSFTQSDSALLKILSDSAYRELAALSDQYAEKVNSAIMKGTLVGSSRRNIEKEVRQLLIGGTDTAGRPLDSHAKTIVATRYMEADRAMTLEIADKIGSDKFRYTGSLIKDSRSFCKERAGKIFTREDIEGWRDLSWPGKKEGDPFTALGGWGCRHHLVPVIEED